MYKQESDSHVLREHMIFQKSHTTNLRDVRTLNMWGFELENIDIISKLQNVETISLSLNKICSLAPFSQCCKLQNLYLRQNCISDLSEIDYLASLPKLTSLMLRDNPIASLPNYRNYIAQKLPNLKKLDDIEISSHEKQFETKVTPNFENIQNISNLPVEDRKMNNFNSTVRRGKPSTPSYKESSTSHVNSSEDDDSYSPNSTKYSQRNDTHDPIRKRYSYHSRTSTISDCHSNPNSSNSNSDYHSNISHHHTNSDNHQNTTYGYHVNQRNDTNMLTAVLSLLPELSDESIQVVLDAISQRRNS